MATGSEPVDLSDLTDLTDLTVRIEDRVALVTLSRPDRRNAFSRAMGESLGRVYAACDADDTIRAVVLTGDPEGRAFCAGADLSPGPATFDAPDATRAFSASPVRPPAWEVRKPVIAAVNAHAIGIGLTLAMQCDIRFVARGARYGFVHVRRGVIPDAHSHWTVPRAAGFAVAAELFLTGREFTAEEAVSWGLASRALPSGEVVPAALALADEIAGQTSPLSVAISKRLLWSQAARDPRETERLETAMHHHLMGRPDAREGAVAYLERRTPQWESSPTRDWPRGALE
ncbi:MAG: enoyl-CoA hydratase-related protein [Acidimicrobiia bacterium]